MSDYSQLADYLRSLPPDPHGLADTLYDLADLEQRKSSLEAAIAEARGEIDRLNSEIVRLNDEVGARQHQVQAIGIEAEGRARDLVSAAEIKAAQLISEAQTEAMKVRKDASDYRKRIVARMNKISQDLTAGEAAWSVQG